MYTRKRTALIATLFPLVASFALALDLYIPVVPKMRVIFNTTAAMVQWTLSIFILVTGIGQLLFGPLSDQFGRKKVILVSTLFFLVGSLLCAYSLTIGMLITSRAIQALGACGMYVCAFGVVRDAFSDRECATITSYLNATIGVSPFIGPVLGGYLIYYFDWKATFYFLALFASVILLLIFFFQSETHLPEKRLKITRDLFLRYWSIVKLAEFQRYAFGVACGTACFFTFFSISPYILEELLDVSLHHFGYYFGFIGATFFVCSFIAGNAAYHYGAHRVVVSGAISLILCGITMGIWYYGWGLSTYGLIVPMVFFGIGGAAIIGPGSGAAITPFPHIAGSAAAVLGMMNFFIAFIVGSFVMYFPIESTIPLALTMATMGFAALLRLSI